MTYHGDEAFPALSEWRSPGGTLLLKRQPSRVKPRLHVPGALLVSGAVFCLVYGFSNTAAHSWATPSTYGFLAAGVALGAGFAAWQGRAAHPLLPPRVVLDRNRGGAYASMLIGTAGLFGTFLFPTYYLQQTLGYSPLVTGVAFLPISGGLVAADAPTAQAKAGPALVTAPRANRLIDLRGFLIHCPALASARSWVICAATIMVDGCTGVRSAPIWRTQSQALPRCPSVASMVDE